MLELVDVGPRSLSAYRGVAPDAVLDDLVRRLKIVPVWHRDPVCGMSVSVDGAAPEARFAEATYRFCSDACREQFLRDPAHYVARRHTV